jgi:inositol-polyphosphate multikinase
MSADAASLSPAPSAPERPRSVRPSGTETPREDILRSLETHDGQVGGHAGVMRSGSLIVKPCTQSEIDFYALANQTAPLFAAWMPTYMGQLTLNKPGVDPLQSLRESAGEPREVDVGEGVVVGKGVSALLESERFEQAIVLENLEWGFRRPSVLDVKLGRVLTDEECEEEKRIRLQRSSMSTTSWEHHLRLTGMRVTNPTQPKPPKRPPNAPRMPRLPSIVFA